LLLITAIEIWNGCHNEFNKLMVFSESRRFPTMHSSLEQKQPLAALVLNPTVRNFSLRVFVENLSASSHLCFRFLLYRRQPALMLGLTSAFAYRRHQQMRTWGRGQLIKACFSWNQEAISPKNEWVVQCIALLTWTWNSF